MKEPRWTDLTALFGGSFDPPHLGHRQAALGLLKNPGVARVIALPTGRNALKLEQVSDEHRLKMTQICFSPEIEVSNEEITRAHSTQTPSYTYDTLLRFSQRFDQKIAFSVGIDQIPKFSKWYRYPEVFELAHWIILNRKEDTPSSFSFAEILHTYGFTQLSDALFLTPKKKKVLKLVQTDAQALSSTDIRAQIAKTGSISLDFLTPNVREYLLQNRLYGSNPSL